MATHNMYCVGLKRKVDATVDGVTHMVTSKGSKYQIKGHFNENGKTHKCTSMCSKAVYDSMKNAGVSASVKDSTVVLDAEDEPETPEEVTEVEEEADVEQPEVDDAYTDESGEEVAPAVVEETPVAATADTPEGSEPLSYDPTAESPMDEGGPAASFSADHESAFDKLEDEVADQYEDKGMDDEEAQEIGAKVAYDAGVKKYGKAVMEEAARKGVPAHTLVKHSEGLEPQTSFGGDLASLEDFDGVESVVVEAPLGHGVTQYYAEGEDAVVPDPSSFPAGSGHVIGSQTASANYTPLHAEDATSADYDPLATTPGPHLDESVPSDSFEAMAVYSSGPGDVNKGMAALISKSPTPIRPRGNFLAWGPKYLTLKEGSKHNKYHLFVVFELDNGKFMPANAYGRIGYGARTWFGPEMSSKNGAIWEAEKKMSKKALKGYNLEFGAEEDSAPMESHPTDYDPLTAGPSDEGGPSDHFGWSEEDAEVGAFSAEFIANADSIYCAECFEAHCTDHKHAEDGPSPLDYDPLTAGPADEGGPSEGPSDHFEAEKSGISMVAGVGIVLGLIAAYSHSDKIADLFRQLGSDE